MKRLLRPAVSLLLALAALSAAATASTAATAVGTLSVCNASGSPGISGVLTYTLAAPGGAGGTITQTASVGTCAANVFFPVGTQVVVTETVPGGDAVTGIKLSGGSESTLGQIALSAGEATVTIGTGQAVLTFTTKGPGVATKDCVVPSVVGLTLSAARAAMKRAGCRVGSVGYVYSSRIPKGGVTSVNPKRGTHHAHGARVRLLVSRGRKP
jgi:hypothetical protein